MKDEYKNQIFSSYSPNPAPSCGNCRKTPALVLSMLNPKTGGMLRMFKCDCGEQIWTEDRK